MKINKKIIISVLIIILSLILISGNIFAATIGVGSIHNDNSLGDADTDMQNIGSKVLTVISNIGVVLSVTVIAFIGIKYMIGSADERAEYKKTMMPYIIGAILVFSASTIGKIVYNIASSIK